jgi:hypothetical protein
MQGTDADPITLVATGHAGIGVPFETAAIAT